MQNVTVADNACGGMKTITEMSSLYEVSLRTLRFYEDRGLISPTRIGTQRFYAGKDEVRLQIILKSKRFGFTLLEVEQMILSRVDRHPDTARLSPAQAAIIALTPALVAQRIRKLEQQRAAIDEAITEMTVKMREKEAV